MFSIDGNTLKRKPEKQNEWEDTTKIVIKQMENADLHTHIVGGDIVRRYDIKFEQSEIDTLLPLNETEVTVVFDSLTFTGKMYLEPLINNRDFTWDCQVTFYETN